MSATSPADAQRFRVLGIAGSLRAASLNRRALEAMRELRAATFAVDVRGWLDAIPPFNEDLEAAGVPAAVADLRQSVLECDGLLIATPEYNQSIPGVLKNLIDWLSRGEVSPLAGKPVAILGVTTGPWGTRLAQAAVRQTLTACGARIMPAPQIYLREAAPRFDAQGALVDASTRAQFGQFLDAFHTWIKQ